MGIILASFGHHLDIIWASFGHDLESKIIFFFELEPPEPEPAEQESEPEPAEPEPAGPETRQNRTEPGASWIIGSPFFLLHSKSRATPQVTHWQLMSDIMAAVQPASTRWFSPWGI